MQTKTDVCLILEGTYPYVPGGVSYWTHQLIRSLKEFTFSLAVILPDRDPNREYKYDLPPNVRAVQEIYLHDHELPEGCTSGKLEKEAWKDLDTFHQCPRNGQAFQALESLYKNFFNSETRKFSPHLLADAKQSWQVLEELYQQRASDESFIDYFWTFRFMHYPIFKIMSCDLPEAGVYHALSTGYAGLLGATAKLKYQRPLVLTEHGIYTRERRFEISRADWIYEKTDDKIRIQRSQSRFKELWNTMFATLSQICYEYSDQIVTLFEGNKEHELKDGAPEEKISIIPNGIDYDAFASVRKEAKKDPGQLVLGFMGRVVSIKDVKTFIRACKAVSDIIPNLKVYLMGPTDEEPEYYQECLKLTEFLGISKIVEFTGKVPVRDYYQKIDILALTSISEAQPLVILEANCVGIPVVATDVGACRELLDGRTEEDIHLGKSGLVAGITNAEEISQAIIKIWRSKDLRDQMGQAGRERVRRYYNRKDLDDRYRGIYNHHLKVS